MIPNIDAKDLYLSNHYNHPDKVGYRIRYPTGEINPAKFTAAFDHSLDLMKLRDVFDEVYNGSRIYKRKNFSFFARNKEYSQRIACVTFKYAVKEFNRIRSGLYIRNGYRYDEVKFHDCLCWYDGAIIAVQTGTPVESPVEIEKLTKYFTYEEGCYKAKTNIKTVMDVASLRRVLYDDGFYMDGIHYIRYKRSTGSSRVGKCLFIDELLYPKMHTWEMCGLTVNEGQDVDLAALEASFSLTLSSIVDTVEINPYNILLIQDYESKFKDKVIAVREKDGKLVGSEEETEVSNSIWDGQSLMDASLFGKYKDKGFLLLRNRFFKSACFNTNLQQWLADNGVTSIEQLRAAGGKTTATRIEDIKLVTTPSSIKYLKFSSYEQWLDNLDPTFGIVKHEKPTHFFDGRMVQAHYQLLSTLQMNEQEVKEFLQPTLDYIKLLKTDPDVVRFHIKYPENQEFELTPANSKNDVVYKMLGVTDKFAQTKLFRDFQSDLVESYMINARCGHVLVDGNYSTLLGNGVEMLQAAIGTFEGKSVVGVGHIHSKRFSYGTTILGSRSPHVSIGNVWLTQNAENDIIDRYFNMTNEIVYVNSIDENLLARLSGCDFDSDTVMLTDNPILIEAAQRNYDNFPVATSLVSAKKLRRKYTSDEKADLDIKTSVNKIGEIINLAQELNTQIWDLLNNGYTMEDVRPLYLEASKLNVLSNIEIDRSKREFTVDSTREIKAVKEQFLKRDKKGRLIKPNFFGVISKKKGYYDAKRKNYKRHDATMDYIQKLCTSLPREKKSAPIPFSSLLRPMEYDWRLVNNKQVADVINLVRDTRREISNVWKAEDLPKTDRYLIASSLRQECIDRIASHNFSSHTMYRLLSSIEYPANSDIGRTLFSFLFGIPNESFFRLIQAQEEGIKLIIPDPNGDIIIFSERYSKREREPNTTAIG